MKFFILIALFSFQVFSQTPPSPGSSGSTIPLPTGSSPQPTPPPSNDFVTVGERVFYQPYFYEVLSVNSQTGSAIIDNDVERLNVYQRDLAKTVGCSVGNRNGDFCVGQMTIGLNRVYYKIIGVYVSGKVVVMTTDASHTIYDQIDPNSLYHTPR